MYSKTRLKQPLKKKTKNLFSRPICNTFDLHLDTICHKDLCFCLFLSDRFRQVILYLDTPSIIFIFSSSVVLSSLRITSSEKIKNKNFKNIILYAPNKNGYLKIIFLISQPKHMLLVLYEPYYKNVSMRRFF